MGTFLIEDLHEVNHNVSEQTKSAMLYLAATPLLEAISQFHAGLLLQHHYSMIVGAASLADIGLQVVLTIILIQTSLKETNPILIPLTALFMGFVVRMSINIIGYYCKVHKRMKAKAEEPLQIKKVILFIWPLAFVAVIQRISRPVINLLVARNQAKFGDSVESLSILLLVYPMAKIFYAWMKHIKETVITFMKEKDGHRAYTTRELTYFTGGCLLFCMLITFPTFWIPGSPEAIMHYVMGVDWELARLCVVPLKIFTFICITVAIRSHLTGWLMSKKKTQLLAPSGFLRLIAIIAACFIFPLMNVNGAPLGVVALLVGFIVETLCVILGAVYVLKKHVYDTPVNDEFDLPEEYTPYLSHLAIAGFGSQQSLHELSKTAKLVEMEKQELRGDTLTVPSGQEMKPLQRRYRTKSETETQALKSAENGENV